MKTIHRSSKGFTIIEVSLVLAIAGLIFVMIFVALPALQRQSRDAKRREDTLILISAIKKYQQNNRGALPEIEDDHSYWYIYWDEENDPYFLESNWGKFYTDYLGNNFNSPENINYRLLPLSCNSPIGKACQDYFPHEHFDNRTADWFIYIGATCQDNKPYKSSNLRNVAVVVKLETDVYCAST